MPKGRAVGKRYSMFVIDCERVQECGCRFSGSRCFERWYVYTHIVAKSCCARCSRIAPRAQLTGSYLRIAGVLQCLVSRILLVLLLVNITAWCPEEIESF